MCGIDHGRSVDTTMGFSPLEGLMMGTRCGDLDPGVLLHLMKNENMGYDELNELLNKKSGLLGLSGVSSDLREIEAAADGGNHRAMLAIKTYAYRVRKYIGAYMAAMGGMDVLVFTGGIGQGSVLVRSLACQGLDVMGISIDEKKNREAKGFKEICDISSADSRVKVLVVPADEERMIARTGLVHIGTAALGRSHGVPQTDTGDHRDIRPSCPSVPGTRGSAVRTGPRTDRVQTAFHSRRFRMQRKGASDRTQGQGGQRQNPRSDTQADPGGNLHDRTVHAGDSPSPSGNPAISTALPESPWKVRKERSPSTKALSAQCGHIHMTPEDALKMGLKDRDVVRVKVPGDRELVFGDVLVRVDPDARLYMHIDTDEANAANLKNGVEGYVEAIQLRR